MKKKVCLILAVMLVLSLAACSGMPKFDSTALTDAQNYAFSAISGYTIENGYELKSAKVMLTDDLKADLKGVDFDKWDVSDVTAVVVAKIGKTSAGTDTATADDTSSAADTAQADTAESAAPASTEKTLVFLMGADKKTIFAAGKGATSDATAAPSSDTVLSSGDYDADALRRTLASAELSQESFIADNAETEGFNDFIADAEAKITADDQYWYSGEYLNAVTASDALTKWDENLRECTRLENRIKQLDAMADLTEDEKAAALDLLDSNEELENQRFEIYKSLRKVEAQLEAFTAENSKALEPIIAKLDELEGKDDYLYNEDYLKLCMAGTTQSAESAASGEYVEADGVGNKYDVFIRQKYVFESSLAALDECAKTEDLNERDYILERCSLSSDNFTAYTHALKTYIQCVVNLDNFKTENEAALKDYETSIEAAKKAAGANYEKDVDYIKVGLKYEDLIKSRDAYEKAVTASKEDADGIKADCDEALKKLDDAEAERLDGEDISAEKAALLELLSGELESVSEYEATSGQWGDLHPDFAAYQNEHLKRPSSGSGYSSYNSNSSSNSNDDGGIKYNKDDELYFNNDANGDGKINDEEFQNALGDYMDQLMGQ